MRKFGIRIFIMCAMALAAALLAQITPETPVKNFKLPMFGADGSKIWDLQGAQGIYHSAEQIEVTEMQLRIYAGGAVPRVENTIQSPRATINTKESRAWGDSDIKVTGLNFEMTGRDWSWEAATQTIKVRKAARLTVAGELGSILK